MAAGTGVPSDHRRQDRRARVDEDVDPEALAAGGRARRRASGRRRRGGRRSRSPGRRRRCAGGRGRPRGRRRRGGRGRRQVGGQVVAAGVVEPGGHGVGRRLVGRRRRPGWAQRTIVCSWLTVASGAISATWRSLWAGTLTATAAWSTVSRPASNAAEMRGWVWRASARRTSWAAWGLETPAFQVSQWVSERMPRPAQALVARASATRSTSSACRALSCPTTTARRSSMSAAGSADMADDRTIVRCRRATPVRDFRRRR